MKSILLVEDNDLISRLYKIKLEKNGYSIDTASTVDSSWNLLLNKNYDLVLLDIMLPGGQNGFDLLERMKKDERYKNIPTIVITNLDGEEKTAEEIGADGYLIKSNISLDTLLSKINSLILK